MVHMYIRREPYIILPYILIESTSNNRTQMSQVDSNYQQNFLKIK